MALTSFVESLVRGGDDPAHLPHTPLPPLHDQVAVLCVAEDLDKLGAVVLTPDLRLRLLVVAVVGPTRLLLLPLMVGGRGEERVPAKRR